jgi:hypothetical protein
MWAAISNVAQMAGILIYVRNPEFGDGISLVSLQ